MNEFFTNLVGRHLGTCDTIQPRTPGRFEPEHARVATASPNAITNSTVMEEPERNQTLQPPREGQDEPAKNFTSKINPPKSPVDHRDYSIDPLSVTSVDAPKETIRGPGLIGNNQDYSFTSLPEQTETAGPLGITERQAEHSNFIDIPEKPYGTRPLDNDRYFHLRNVHLGALEQDRPNKTAGAVEEHDAYSDRNVRTNIDESHAIMHDQNSAPSRSYALYSESELNHRISAMLQRLADDLVPPYIEADSADRGSQKNESLMPLPSVKNPLLPDASAAMPGPAPFQAHLLDPQAGRQDRFSADDRNNTPPHARLAPPSWLLDLQSRFLQHLPENEAKTEPAVNVTIGRVEVRAVQADAPKNAQRPKKPTGVMTLDEYLKQREGRGAR